jgi:GAF domain-containing protein
MDRLMDRVRSNDAGHGPSSLQQENLALLRLHALTRRLLAMEDIDSALYAVLDAAIELQQADFGAIHVHHPVADKLRLAVQRGLANAYLDRFAEVGADNLSACARTLRAGEPIIIDDVERDDEYGPLRELAVQTGYRAVHATPLTTTAGRLIGILSRHLKRPCRP